MVPRYLALGYEDQNDADALRHDPLWRTSCDRLPDDARGLSFAPTTPPESTFHAPGSSTEELDAPGDPGACFHAVRAL